MAYISRWSATAPDVREVFDCEVGSQGSQPHHASLRPNTPRLYAMIQCRTR